MATHSSILAWTIPWTEEPGGLQFVEHIESDMTKETWQAPAHRYCPPRSFSCSYTASFPGDSDRKESSCNAGDPGLIPGLGRSPGEGNGHPTQYSCLENPMDRGSWSATVHGVAKHRTRLSD